MTLRAMAAKDLRDGFAGWPIWTQLAWLDIRKRYQRTIIGPFWLTISTGVWAMGITLVWSTLFHIELEGYMPFLTAGIVVWTMLAQVLNEAPTVFLTSRAILESVDLPNSLQILRFIARHLIVYVHNLPVFLIVALIFGSNFNFYTLLFVPGLLLVIVNVFWATLFLATLGVRFRDVQPIVASAVQITFFLTPIFWHKEFLGNKTFIADVNPLYHLIEVVRAPLLGHAPDPRAYVAVIAMALVGLIFSFLFYSRFRIRIHYWI